MALDGTETSVPAGIVTPLENVNGRSVKRLVTTRKKRSADQHLVLDKPGNESNGLVVTPSSRCVSRRKLSIWYILSIPAFVQPSSLVTVSTSLRRGSIYSGLERSRYNNCAIV